MAFGEITSWVSSNWILIGEAYLSLVGFASIIVKLTPTVKDDNILKGFLRFTGKFVALNRKK